MLEIVWILSVIKHDINHWLLVVLQLFLKTKKGQFVSYPKNLDSCQVRLKVKLLLM